MTHTLHDYSILQFCDYHSRFCNAVWLGKHGENASCLLRNGIVRQSSWFVYAVYHHIDDAIKELSKGTDMQLDQLVNELGCEKAEAKS